MWTARPYDPAFAARAVSLGREGASRAEIAVGLGASLADLAAWAGEHADFAVALEDADTEARAWWEGLPRRALAAGIPLAASLWAKVMMQRYGRTGHSARQPDPEEPETDEVVTRLEIPDNGRRRRPRRSGAGD
jgi:hypothetical protein